MRIGEVPLAPQDVGRTYDSFVVRTWTEAETGRLLTAEVEHIQSGAVSRGMRVPLAWIAEQLRDRVARGGRDGDE